jgi:hypothetical protein
MVFVSVTRLRVRSPRYLPAFAWHNLLSIWQIISTPGFLGGRLMGDVNGAFWTLTLWSDRSATQSYRNSGAHRRAMPKLQDWCDEAAVAHWEQAGSNLPDWTEAHQRMVTDGHLTKLSKPSLAHLKRDIPVPVTKNSGLLLRPRRRNATHSGEGNAPYQV